jgi:predicted house-cleaning noncanonical NTP pyrophosphatase (MazG superfamily)
MTLAAMALTAVQAVAADRDKVEAFLTVTGFDVALESIKLSAEDAPRMLGLQAEDFGAAWTLMSSDVFDVEDMQDDATRILEQTLSDEALAHAADFYASDLGQRLVEAENESHLRDREEKREEGGRLLAQMTTEDDPRLDVLERMLDAIGSEEQSLRAANELEVRFLMAAQEAGVIRLRVDEEGLRAAQAEQAEETMQSMRLSGLASSAATYKSFTDEELVEYTEALEHPLMQEVYELMNAVQFEIMADRFELVAEKLAEINPGQEL